MVCRIGRLRRTLAPTTRSPRPTYFGLKNFLPAHSMKHTEMDATAFLVATLLFDMGIELKLIEVIPDERARIIESVARQSKQYDFVFTSGGIGTTHDDITYDSIADAFNQPLARHQPTVDRMKKMGMLSQNSPEQDALDIRLRMATFPAEARVVYPIDSLWTPIVIVNENVHILPGVPHLFEAMLRDFVPHMKQRIQGLSPESLQPLHRVNVVTTLIESTIAPVLAEAQRKFEGRVDIGSYPVWDSVRRTEDHVIVSLVGRDLAVLKECALSIKDQINGKCDFE